MRVLGWLARGVGAALDACNALIGLERGSARRAIFDRWDERATRTRFPRSAERHRDRSDDPGGGWAP